MPQITITKQQALDILDGEDYILDRIIGHSRWRVQHEVFFAQSDKLWRMTYNVGATELQDESPWEYDKEVVCQEVCEVMRKDFEIIKDQVE